MRQPEIVMNDDSGHTVAQRLAHVLVAKTQGRLAGEIIHAAKRCVIDWTCAALAGSAHKQTLALERVLYDELGHGPSYTLSGHRAPTRTAALVLLAQWALITIASGTLPEPLAPSVRPQRSVHCMD